MGGWTQQDVNRVALRQQTAKPSKYHNTKTTIDGITFDSAKEAKRYQELKMLKKAGEIIALELQPRFELYVVSEQPVTQRITVGHYHADFAYWTRAPEGHQVRVVEDVKSSASRTEAYRLRKRIVEALYGITVTEV